MTAVVTTPAVGGYRERLANYRRDGSIGRVINFDVNITEAKYLTRDGVAVTTKLIDFNARETEETGRPVKIYIAPILIDLD
jgi:hypothetical protein